MFDFAIIGGGASGMYASILLAKKGYSVALLESNDRVGKKLLATGNGKCNLSNIDISAKCYNTDKIEDIVKNFDMQKQMAELGLVTKIKSGRIYPFSEQSNNVLNVLLKNMDRYGVNVLINHTASDIKIGDNIGIVTSRGNIACKKVCLATGSTASFGKDSLNLYKSIGHKVVKTEPSLAPLMAVKQEQIKGLNGVRQEANVSLFVGGKLIASEFGEVQFRKDGISGIVILNHSARLRWSGAKVGVCYLDFMPNYSAEQVAEFLKNKITAEFGLLNKNLMQIAVKFGVDGIKKYKIDVMCTDDNKQAQVMHGGLNLNEFDLNNMSSKYNPNCFAIGEALDVDGLCGGYNLHFAFGSAYNFAKEF